MLSFNSSFFFFSSQSKLSILATCVPKQPQMMRRLNWYFTEVTNLKREKKSYCYDHCFVWQSEIICTAFLWTAHNLNPHAITKITKAHAVHQSFLQNFLHALFVRGAQSSSKGWLMPLKARQALLRLNGTHKNRICVSFKGGMAGGGSDR